MGSASEGTTVERPAPAVGQRWNWMGGMWRDFTLVERHRNGDWVGRVANSQVTGHFDAKMMSEATFLGYAPGHGPTTPEVATGVEIGQHRRWVAKGGRGFTVTGHDPSDAKRMLIKFDDIGTHSYRIDDIAKTSVLEPLTAAPADIGAPVVAPATPPVPSPVAKRQCHFLRQLVPGHEPIRCGAETSHARSPYCETHISEEMQRRDAANAKLPQPPGRFQQAHTGGFVGVWSLRDEGSR